MFPWGHLAVGYLCYSLVVRLRGRDSPLPTGVLAVALGTQLPDLIDKPLAWWFGLIPNGRSLAHSVLVGGVFAVLVWRLAAWYGREHEGGAFALGYLTHLGGDALYPIVYGRSEALGFLGWPLVPPLEYDHTGGFLEFFAGITVGPTFVFEIALVVFASWIWYHDGLPGGRIWLERLLVVAGLRERAPSRKTE